VRSVQFVIGIILARLLLPEQFGLIGMLTIFIAVGQCFLDSGFGAALIRKREATPTDICSIFYFNVAVGLVVTSLLSLAAPWIATFFKQPTLIPLTRALSLTIVINSLGLIQNVMLNKQINFKTQTKISLIAGVLSGTIGVSLAVAGFGVWSLAIQQVSSALIRNGCLWIFRPWRPALLFSFKALREMFSFASRLLCVWFLSVIFDNIYLVVIGKLYSAADLGFFTRAKALREVPTQTLWEMVGRVTFPVFATIQDDTDRVKRGLKKALTTLALVNFPMMIGLAVTARPLVLVLLTEKWAESIPYFQLLCLVGLSFPVYGINLNVVQALGRADIYFRLEIVKKVLIGINIAVTWQWGISAMICGMFVVEIISYNLNSYYTGILIGYPMREQLRDLFPYLLMAVLMGMSVYVAGFLPFPNNWTMLVVQIVSGIIIYGFLCRIFRLTAFMETWEAVCDKMPFLRAGTA